MQDEANREELETACVQVALKFSTAMLNGQFDEAYSFLGSAICDEWTPSLLQETYEEMVEHFNPNQVAVELAETEMPGMKPSSVWVYVSIFGQDDGDGIEVVVSNENGKYLIQKLELWARAD